MAAATDSQAKRVSDGVFMAGSGRQITTAGRAGPGTAGMSAAEAAVQWPVW
jgi:hypothetical protein